jgi:hypothetical protein
LGFARGMQKMMFLKENNDVFKNSSRAKGCPMQRRPCLCSFFAWIPLAAGCAADYLCFRK